MKSTDARDEMLEPLQILEPLTPDAARAEQVRRRCREELARARELRQGGAARLTPAGATAIAVGGLCLLYLAELMTVALRVATAVD
jgi:hypothetical protein